MAYSDHLVIIVTDRTREGLMKKANGALDRKHLSITTNVSSLASVV